METSFPEDRIGDEDSFSGVHVRRVLQWTEGSDVVVSDDSLSALPLQNVEAKFGRRENLASMRHRCRIVGFDTQEVSNHSLPIHSLIIVSLLAGLCRGCLPSTFFRARQTVAGSKNATALWSRRSDQSLLLLDVYDVDQYGRLLVDVRGVRVEDQTTLLQRWTLAEECVRAGWAHLTPWHIVPDVVREALQTAITNRAGAWGLQTEERHFQGTFKSVTLQVSHFQVSHFQVSQSVIEVSHFQVSQSVIFFLTFHTSTISLSKTPPRTAPLRWKKARILDATRTLIRYAGELQC